MPDMTHDEVQQTVIRIIAEHFFVDEAEITRDTRPEIDLHADSLGSVELIMELEDEFDVSIPDEDVDKRYANDGTVGAWVDYVFDAIS